MPVVWLDPIPAIVFAGGPLACEIIGTSSWLGEVTMYIRITGPRGGVVYLANITSAYQIVGELPQ